MEHNLTTPQGVCDATIAYLNVMFRSESVACARWVRSRPHYKVVLENYQKLVVESANHPGTDRYIEQVLKPAGRDLWNLVGRLKEEFHAKEAVNG